MSGQKSRGQLFDSPHGGMIWDDAHDINNIIIYVISLMFIQCRLRTRAPFINLVNSILIKGARTDPLYIIIV